MLPLVWIGIIAIALVAVVLVMRQSQGKPLLPGSSRQPLPSLHRTLFTLQIGDIVQYERADWVVEDRLTYDSQGYTWSEYLLQDTDQIRWLSVEEDDRVEVCWLEPVKGLEISASPPSHITVADIVYQMEESGRATMTRLSATTNRQPQQCRYFDYSGADDRVMSVEDWGGDVEITSGRQIPPKALTLLPGDGRRVYDGQDA